ncbi:hypothetical protein [Kordiimonas sp.]|uniref:hypothetical protein n=1 Tax=Kordiimonas sp. TaxID=1970157 RepID=UPI003B52DBF6
MLFLELCERHNRVMFFIRYHLERLRRAEYIRIRTGDLFHSSRMTEAGVIFMLDGSPLVAASDAEAEYEALSMGCR